MCNQHGHLRSNKIGWNWFQSIDLMYFFFQQKTWWWEEMISFFFYGTKQFNCKLIANVCICEAKLKQISVNNKMHI